MIKKTEHPPAGMNNKINIGFVGNIPEPVGGAEIFLDNLISHLGAYPTKTVLARWLKQSIDLGGNTKLHFEYTKKETINFDEKRGIKIYYLFSEGKRPEISSPAKILWQSLKLARFFYREKVDIIHCHLLVPNIYFGLIASRILKVPFLVTIHGMVDLIQPGYIFSNRRIKELEFNLLTRLLRRCDGVIGVSDEIVEYCRERGIEKISKISAGIDTEFFKPHKTQERGILFIGNLNHRKGFDLLLEAYRKIRDETEEPLYLVGKNPDMLDCKEKNVFYLGLLGPDKLLHVIQKSKLVVLPSRTEGLPLSVLEAMSCNKPVLVSPVGELVSVINDSENGFFLKDFSSEKLGRQILYIINNYSNLKAVIGDNPRKSVLKFDIRRIAEMHWGLYQELTSSNSH